MPTDDLTCKWEKVITTLMFWFDTTHLASFSTAKLWPIYLLFGNLSKYVRCQPNSDATKYVAYIPSLPDALQDELKSFHTKWETQKKDILTHCWQELMHTIWPFLLDEEFQHTYKYRIVVQGPDQIKQCVYPWIITYSADYPKKLVFVFTSAHIIAYYFGRVMLATIYDQGLCPCPCCLVLKQKLNQLGSSEDTRN